MKISERGQVTIPQEIRDHYGFLPFLDVEFVMEGGDLLLRKTNTVNKTGISALYGKKKLGKSTDELMKLLR